MDPACRPAAKRKSSTSSSGVQLLHPTAAAALAWVWQSAKRLLMLTGERSPRPTVAKAAPSSPLFFLVRKRRRASTPRSLLPRPRNEMAPTLPRVLLIEDEPPIRKFVRAALTGALFQIDEA